MKQYLHISVMYAKSGNNKLIDNALTDPNGDWLRYNSSCWIVWTDKTPEQISAIVKRCLAPNDQYLVLALKNGTALGYLPNWIWTWINKNRA